jgi:hypothetical protein
VCSPRGMQTKKMLGENIPSLTDLISYWLKIEDKKDRFIMAESQCVVPERDTGNKDAGCELRIYYH